jgi:hypothetical protein
MDLRRYDQCFLKWYSESKSFSTGLGFELWWTLGLVVLRIILTHSPEYLKGKTDNAECAKIFKEYNQCLTVRWRFEVQEVDWLTGTDFDTRSHSVRKA